MSTFGERLREERKRLGISQIAFAELGGAKKHSQINYEADKSSPSSDYIAALVQAGVDILYVLTGQRTPVLPPAVLQAQKQVAEWRAAMPDMPDIALDTDPPLHLTKSNSGFAAPRGLGRIAPVPGDGPLQGDFCIDDKEFALIRRFAIDVSAGTGLVLDGEPLADAVVFSSAWLKRRGISAELAGLVQVRGDSMEPTIPDGALIVVHRGEMRIDRDGIYAFAYKGEAFVKRLLIDGRTPDNRFAALRVVSDNPAHPEHRIEGEMLNDITVAGRVRAVLTDLD